MRAPHTFTRTLRTGVLVLRKICTATAFLLSSWAFSAAAQDSPPPYGPAITLDAARKIIVAAEAEAKKAKVNLAICILDSAGQLVLAERMDNTQYASMKIAEGKALTSVNFRRPTKMFQDAIKGGATPLLTFPGVLADMGGLPIVKDGKLIGAIGLSGASSEMDEQIAQAAVAAFK
jgi:uncharacterized protein GlcG (DUF336 family)